MKTNVCVCVRESGRERELLSSLFPQHQLCGFYEEQMFTTWYSASSPLLTISNASTTNCLHTHKHKNKCTHIQHCLLGNSVIYSNDFLVFGGVFAYSIQRGLFIVRFPLCSGCISCSWVNTWFNQVSLPPLSACTSVGQLWHCTQCSYLTWKSVQRKHMDACMYCT